MARAPIKGIKINAINDTLLSATAKGHEICRHSCWLDEDVGHIEGLRIQMQGLPSLPFIQGIDHLVGLGIDRGHDQHSSMIAKLIDVDSFSYFRPAQATIPGEVGVGFLRLVAKPLPHIPRSHDDAHGLVIGIEGHEMFLESHVVQMKGAAVATADRLPLRVAAGGFQGGPRASGVEGNQAVHRHRRVPQRQTTGGNLCSGGGACL